MVQTHFKTGEEKEGRRICVPLQVVRLVRSVFTRIGLRDYLKSLRERSPAWYGCGGDVHLQPLHGRIDEPLGRTCQQGESDEGLHLLRLHHISRKTMNRALKYLDNYFEEITALI